jgi:hypothetical protein
MTWLTWRQHRVEVLALGVLVGVLGATLLVLGLPMHSLFPGGAARCAVVQPDTVRACTTALMRLHREYGYAQIMLTLFNAVPLAIGAFLGAPLLARELETGTWQLAWTQAVPRMRWLTVKLGVLAAVTVALSVAFAAAVTWYRQPLDTLDGRFTLEGFDLEGPAPAAYALFAFAAATAAGTLLRRSLPALAATVVIYIAARIAVAGWLRPGYRTPRVLVDKDVPANAAPVARGFVTLGTSDPRDWLLEQGYADATGRHLSNAQLNDMSLAARDARVEFPAYLRDHDVQRWVTYHPADRFWSFQLIEAAIFVSLAAMLLAVVVWRVKRRAL